MDPSTPGPCNISKPPARRLTRDTTRESLFFQLVRVNYLGFTLQNCQRRSVLNLFKISNLSKSKGVCVRSTNVERSRDCSVHKY